MPTLLYLPVIALALCVGVGIGFFGGWAHSRPVETKVLYCTAASKDPKCVAAREQLKRAATNPALSSEAATTR